MEQAPGFGSGGVIWLSKLSFDDWSMACKTSLPKVWPRRVRFRESVQILLASPKPPNSVASAKRKNSLARIKPSLKSDMLVAAKVRPKAVVNFGYSMAPSSRCPPLRPSRMDGRSREVCGVAGFAPLKHTIFNRGPIALTRWSKGSLTPCTFFGI